MTKILYLHGFASSADSTKADLTKSFIEKKTKKTKILIPDLDNDIEVAFYQIENIISEESITAFIGSS
ncbi:MAG: esterase, partial [SAR86 cluster bacterium]